MFTNYIFSSSEYFLSYFLREPIVFIQLLTKTNPVGFHHSLIHVSLIFLNSFQTHFIKWHCLKTVIFFCDENFTYIVIQSTVSFVQRTDLPERWFTYMYFIWIILKRLKYIQKYDFFGDSDWLTYYGSCYSRKKWIARSLYIEVNLQQ